MNRRALLRPSRRRPFRHRLPLPALAAPAAAPIALALALAFAVGGCGRGGEEAGPPEVSVPVRVAPIAVERMALPILAAGTLGPKEDVTLAFTIGGVVSRVLVDEGRTVAAGQLLASLDFGEIDPAVDRARAALEKAERDLERAKRLYADSVATLEQVQNAETARDAARAERDAAAFHRRHAQIVAPAAGVILRRMIEPGELVESGAPAIVFGSRTRGQVVRAWLADRDAVRVRRGDHAAVRFDAIPGRTFQGRVSEIAAAADPMTGTYRVEISLTSAPQAGLASGLVGAVEIQTATDGEVALVPSESVLEADGTSGVVYTLDPDGRHVSRRAVTVAFLAGDRIAIASGLEAARTVVTEGAAYLDHGDAVEVRP